MDHDGLASQLPEGHEVDAEVVLPIPPAEGTGEGLELCGGTPRLDLFLEFGAAGDVAEVVAESVDLVDEGPASQRGFISEIDEFMLAEDFGGTMGEHFRDEQG